jgi:hypothetical protein
MAAHNNPKAGNELPATAPDPVPSIISEAHISQVRETQPVTLFDQNDPRSLINLLSAPMKKAVEEVLFDAETAALMALDELDLYKKLKETEHYSITPTDNRLRLKFWMEYDYCQAYMSKEIDHRRVIAGVCTYESFMRSFLRKPHKVAWLLCPPTGYALKVNEALEFGLDQLRDILETPHSAGGKLDTKLGELKLKIVALLDTRAKGTPIQRQIVANLTGNAAAQAALGATAAETTDALERKLKELDKKERELVNGGGAIRADVIDVTPS